MTSKIVKKFRRRARNKEWLYEVVASKEAGQMTDKLVKLFIELVERLSNRPQFHNYPYKEDMRAHALMQLSKSWHHFKPEKSDNPYAYYTTCAYSSFYYVFNTEQTARQIKEEFEIECATKDTSYEMVDDEQHF